jgi:hypothetical protein
MRPILTALENGDALRLAGAQAPPESLVGHVHRSRIGHVLGHDGLLYT